MEVEDLPAVALAGLWGAAVGVLNHRLVAAPLARLRQGLDARSPEGQAAVKAVARRYLLRLPVSLGALVAVFLVRPQTAPLVAAAAGMMAVHALTLRAELGRLRRPGVAGNAQGPETAGDRPPGQGRS